MSGGIGPVEPGEGTAGRESHERPESGRPAPAAARWARARYARHRRVVLVLGGLTCAAVLAAGAVRLYADRPRPVPYAPPAPSQVVSLTYLEPVEPPPADAAFAFTVRVRNASAGPVEVEGIGQPSRALRVMIRPPLPVTVGAGEAREVVVRILATDCVHVARNSGLPFLEVTLSNGFRKERHSYIPGDRYARDLSVALTRACPEDRDMTDTPPS
ncbi:Tat pathway signal sequence domain protein [Streptomyces sp. NPDC059382]|uniref:Tat pathway signal sequence domain protein n=1 Tax=Streptomyces sp. NPDC059382 TaxID=3346816 RepID=UPI0036C2419D